MHLLAGKALIGHIDAVSGRADTGQTQRGLLASGKEGLGQAMVVATARSKTKASNHAAWRNGGEQMKALIPANAVAPADVGLSGQPARATPFGIAGGDAELSSASYKQHCACTCSTRNKLKATMTSR